MAAAADDAPPEGAVLLAQLDDWRMEQLGHLRATALWVEQYGTAAPADADDHPD